MNTAPPLPLMLQLKKRESDLNNGQQQQVAIQQALQQLQAGHSESAKALFSDLVTKNPSNAQCWLGLAFANSQLSNVDEAILAVDRVLDIEPKNIRAMIFKADHLDKKGESRKALLFYETAMNIAQTLGTLPSDVRQGLERGRRLQEKYQNEYSNYLIEALKSKGYERGISKRFDESLDISFGKSKVYVQEPTRYYFPGLPQKTFYNPAEFEWAEALEMQTSSIKEELEALLDEGTGFEPYLQSDSSEPNLVKHLNIVDNLNWGAYYIWQYGDLIEEHAKQFPLTTTALENLPFPKIDGQAHIALFSKLKAGVHIPPHNGLINTRLICHLPLVVPENCGSLRVGNDVREWQEGKLMVFDDSIEHEAWNKSSRDRVVLLFDIWRPELTADERQLVTDMLLAVDEYGEEH